MTCFGIKDAYQHSDVNIGWFAFRAHADSEIRTIPAAGNLKAAVPAGKAVGLQSVRNPQRKAIVARRKAARAADGSEWVWCYRRQGAQTGWIRLGNLEPLVGEHTPLVGPAGLDFEVGLTTPGVHAESGCGRDARPRPRPDRVRAVASDDVYLRFSPRGTAKHYLHRHDRVLLLLTGGPHGFVFVQVLESSAGNPATPGTRGWLSLSALSE